ncbi:tyrosine-type recombinase/integrase [Methylocella sp.]|uniref:tyrosine-type recombinase/integrase n=1 Tax=Methylocella sp. TaxID=1978226 RepID=UPI0037842D18
MVRARNRLSARQAATLRKPGRHADGGNLYLEIGDGARRGWLYFYQWGGKRKVMGLGRAPSGASDRGAVSLDEARAARDAAEKLVRQGVDPIVERATARQAARATPTFGQIAIDVIEAKAAQSRNVKHAAQWRGLEKDAAALWLKPVDAIDTEAVLGVLRPIWATKPTTARRVQERVRNVLDAAKAHGHRAGDNPAEWRGHLDQILPRPAKVERSHHAALPYGDVPAFIGRLRSHQASSVAAMALEFLILTAARSGEVYGAQWPEIDVEAAIWHVPASRMKGGRAHRVPLCGRALEILAALPRIGDHVFESPRGGGLSHVAMAKVLARLGGEGATVHGFRSSFRDWCGGETNFPRELAEQALAHRLGDAAELAYKRGDFLEKRRAMMEAWALYCDGRQADRS